MKKFIPVILMLLGIQEIYGQNVCFSGEQKEQLTPQTLLKSTKAASTVEEYEVELFPGQESVCDWFYWGGSQGIFSISPEVDWLDVEPDTFSVSGDEVQRVTYNFIAPQEKGTYETYVYCTGWSTIHVKLTVSNLPLSTHNYTVAKLDDTISYNTRFHHNRLDNIGNSGNYFADTNLVYTWTGYPPMDVNSIKITPNPVEIHVDSFKYIQTTFYGSVSDERLIQRIANQYDDPSYYRYKQKQVQPKECVISFDQSTDQYIRTNYYPSDKPVTMMYWVKFSELFKAQACGAHDGNNHRLYLGIDESNNLFAGLGNSYSNNVASGINPNEWVHLALIGNGDSAFVYVNGTEKAKFKYTFTGESDKYIRVGQRYHTTDEHMSEVIGSIDEFQVWEKALTAEEVLYFMNHCPSGSEKELTIYYPFREGEGNFTKDFSGSGYTGFIPNELSWPVDVPNGDPQTSGIYKVSPSMALVEQDTVTINILGNKFDNNSIVKFIKDDGHVTLPFETVVNDSLNLSVKLDVKNTFVGEYDLLVISQSNDTLRLNNCFQLLDEAAIPFGEWVPFKANYGNAYFSAVEVPPLEQLFVFVKKSTRTGYASTWKGRLKLMQDGETIAQQTDVESYGGNILGGSYTDYALQLANTPSGLFTFEIDNFKADIQGDGEIMFAANPPELELNQWDKGKVLRPYGSDWKMVIVPENVDTLFLQTEGFGKWSTIDVFYENINQLENHWQFKNWGEGYKISGYIVKPRAGVYYIKYMDSAVLQRDGSGNLYNHLDNQAREYLINIASNDNQISPSSPTIIEISTTNFGQGEVTFSAKGKKLNDIKDIFLTNGNIVYNLNKYNSRINSELIFNDNFEHLEIGEYDLIFQSSSSSDTVRVTISKVNTNQIKSYLLSSKYYRLGRYQTVIGRIENQGNTNIKCALLNIGVTNDKIELYEQGNSEQEIADLDSINLFHKRNSVNSYPFFIYNLGPNETYEYTCKIYSTEIKDGTNFNISLGAVVLKEEEYLNLTNNIAITFYNSLITCQNTPKSMIEFLETFTKEDWLTYWGDSIDFDSYTPTLKYQTKSTIKNYKESLSEYEEDKMILDLYRKALNVVANNTLNHFTDTWDFTDDLAVFDINNDFAEVLKISSNPWGFVNYLQDRVIEIYDGIIEKLAAVNGMLDDLNNTWPDNQWPELPHSDDEWTYDPWPDDSENSDPWPDRSSISNLPKTSVNSTTPEDKYGPVGASTAINDSVSYHYIDTTKNLFEYKIDYWNKEDATAPAAIVYIRDTIDIDFNLSTLNFTEIGFLKWKLKLDGGSYFNVNVDCRPDMPYIVNVKGTVDPDTREVFWVHTTLDPETMELHEDPLSGYLPPIDSTGYQIGWVNYTIQSEANLPDGTVFTNQAFVNFDGVGKWGPAPKEGPYTNIFDCTKPSSRVLDISNTSNIDSVKISWTGSDTGSGIEDYTIYVSEGDGYSVWKENIADTSAYFYGENGKTYKFYSIAKDRVGNIEPDKENYEAMFSFDITSIAEYPIASRSLVSIFPNPSECCFNIELQNQSATNIRYEVYNSMGQLVISESTKENNWTLDMQGHNKGFYLVKIYLDNNVVSEIVVLK